uniref:Putative secreted peptide n=1 Tax=Anopheles braziliensis TaxID=58242 RepID=A0A2M3ZRF8_9DIPT
MFCVCVWSCACVCVCPTGQCKHKKRGKTKGCECEVLILDTFAFHSAPTYRSYQPEPDHDQGGPVGSVRYRYRG